MCILRRLPVWFSMLHPLADLSPVISRIGTDLNYLSDSAYHMVYASSQSSPYLTVVYDSNAKTHSMHLIRRTTPQVFHDEVVVVVTIQLQML